MSRLADACHMPPFSNGTEGDAWESKWCGYCVHDHGIHADRLGEPGQLCDVIGAAHMGSKRWPECWLPDPDDGESYLPSRLVCTQFSPCTEGDCTGDPGAGDRAVRVAEVTAYWREARP